MKNNTPTSILTPLTAKDLTTIFGGSDDVIDLTTLLDDGSVIVEDVEGL